MRSALSEACGSGETMRRRGEAQREIGEYVRTRLIGECRGTRGAAAAIARATGFTRSHIAQVQRPHAGIGENFARAMATYWRLTYAQLENAASEWAKDHPPPSGAKPPIAYLTPLAQLPGWSEALAEAQRRHRSIPAEVWQDVAHAVLPGATEATAERVGRTAQILYDTSPGQPGYETDVTAPHRRELEQKPPASSTTAKGPPRPARRKVNDA